MTLSVTYRGTDITNLLQLEEADLALTTAADGSTATGASHVDDPAGAVTLLPLGELIVEESACATAPRCFTGTGLNFKINRGTNWVGAGRVWDFDVFDLNELLKRRTLRGSTANRPAESGSARIAWLLTTTGMAGVVFDNGAIVANAWTYEATDFRGQYALDVLESIVSASGELGRVFFVYWDAAAAEPSLFYASPNAAINDSTLRISNVAADVDGTVTFAPADGSELEAQGEAIFDGVYVNYTGGVLYRQRASTFATYGVHVDGTFTWDRITNATYAATHAETFLDRHAGQIDTITVTVRLPKAKVNLIDAGMRISVKFQHLPGFTSFTWTRVARRTIILTAGLRDFYDVQLDLTVRGLDQTGGGSPGDFPHPPGNASIVQFKHADTGGSGQITLDAAPGEGHVLVSFITRRGGTIDAPSAGPAWTEHPHGQIIPGSDSARMFYRTVGAGESATITITGTNGGSASVWELADTDTTPDTSAFAVVSTLVKPATVDAGTITPTAGESAVMLMGQIVHCSDWSGNGPTTVTDGAIWTRDFAFEILNNGDLHPIHWAGHDLVANTAGSYSTTQGLVGGPYNFGGYGGLVLVFAASGGTSPPSAAQWVYDEVVAMSGAAGTTAFSFADGSLSIKVDGVPIINGILSQNGVTGAFTLDFTPLPASGDVRGEIVTVTYQGR